MTRNILVSRAQIVLKFEFTTEVIAIFVKKIKKTLSGMFTLFVSKKMNNKKFSNYSMKVHDFPLGM